MHMLTDSNTEASGNGCCHMLKSLQTLLTLDNMTFWLFILSKQSLTGICTIQTRQWMLKKNKTTKMIDGFILK